MEDDIIQFRYRRRRRWKRNQKRRRRCDGLLRIAGLAACLDAFFNETYLISALPDSLSQLRVLLLVLCALLMYLHLLFGISRRNHTLLMLALIFWAWSNILFGRMLFHLAPVIMLLSLYIVLHDWNPLRKEEGFPDFDIEAVEQEERQRERESFNKVQPFGHYVNIDIPL